MSKKKENIIWIDLLRVLSIIGVIFIHTAVELVVMDKDKATPSVKWLVGDTVTAFSRFAVPCFIMISGVLLLRKEEPIQNIFLKRLPRILLPFFFWGVMYIVYAGKGVLIFSDFYLFFLFLLQPDSMHFWYIYFIIALYLFLPFLRKITIYSSKKEIEYFVLAFIFLSAISSVSFFGLKSLLTKYNYFLMLGSYSIVGYYLYTYKINIPRIISLATYLLCGALIVFVNYRTFPKYVGTEGEISIIVVLMSTAVFLFIKDVKITETWLIKLIMFLSKYSFGVYLAHMLVFRLLVRGTRLFILSIVNLAVVIPIITLVISYTVIYLLTRIPYLRKVVN